MSLNNDKNLDYINNDNINLETPSFERLLNDDDDNIESNRSKFDENIITSYQQ